MTRRISSPAAGATWPIDAWRTLWANSPHPVDSVAAGLALHPERRALHKQV